jgi:hypothetical protein
MARVRDLGIDLKTASKRVQRTGCPSDPLHATVAAEPFYRSQRPSHCSMLPWSSDYLSYDEIYKSTLLIDAYAYGARLDSRRF